MSTATDTIVAPATPFGYGGIAVIRLSGPSSKNIARAITFLSDGKKPSFKPRQSTHVLIAEKSGKTFDEGLITFFKSPNSYTGLLFYVQLLGYRDMKFQKNLPRYKNLVT